MENSPNTQNNNQQNQRERPRNSRSRYDQNRNVDKNKRFSQINSQNGEEDRNVKSGSRDRVNNQNRAKTSEGSRYSDKSTENRGQSRNAQDTRPIKKARPPYKSVEQGNASSNTNQVAQNGSSSSSRPRYNRNASRFNSNNESKSRIVNAKHIETIEDIQADVERIEKDIQFEIKQIKAVKLGI